MLHGPGRATLDVVQSTAFGEVMNGPKAKAAVEIGFTAVSGQLHPAGAEPT
jgi:hypothetical protein